MENHEIHRARNKLFKEKLSKIWIALLRQNAKQKAISNLYSSSQTWLKKAKQTKTPFLNECKS